MTGGDFSGLGELFKVLVALSIVGIVLGVTGLIWLIVWLINNVSISFV